MRPRRVVPAAASDWLRQRLGRTWTRGEVVGVGERAAYVRLDHGRPHASVAPRYRPLLALEGPGAVGLPNGIDVADPGVVEHLRVGTPVVVDPVEVRIDTVVVAVRRWRRSRPTTGPADARTVRRRLRALGIEPTRPVPRGWPDPPARLLEGVAGLAGLEGPDGPGAGSSVDALLARLLGWGPGSTPSGDDLLAAWIATATVLAAGRPSAQARVVAAVRVRAATHTTALSATLLDAAGDGAMARPAAAVLAALTAPPGHADGRHDRVAELSARLDDLATVGHTSGRDLACGMLGAVVHHLGVPTAATPRSEGT